MEPVYSKKIKLENSSFSMEKYEEKSGITDLYEYSYVLTVEDKNKAATGEYATVKISADDLSKLQTFIENMENDNV